jgi:hydroxymethylpyrimidine pyrophosphatase-like HAD family hydrolase
MYTLLDSDKALFCDVDDTLITWDLDKWYPNTKVVDLIKRFNSRNQPVIVWSAGGYEWAQTVVDALQIQEFVTLVMAKPAWFCDDKIGAEILPEGNRIDPAELK